jgi:APA family basic amino acid/polyamine antiporter
MEPATFWAVAIVLVLTVINHVGIVVSGRVQVVLTSIPVAVLLTMSLVVIGQQGLVTEAATSLPARELAPVSMASLALAYLPVYFAYSGWNAAIFVGGEIKDPGRNLPRALVGGTLVVLALYLVLCVGFLAVFPLDELAGVGEAGTAAAREVFGATGEIVVTTLILLAMLGSINGTVMTGSRIAYAMADLRHAPRKAGVLHPRFRTPVFALWLQAGWTMVLLATQRFEELMNYTSAAMLITGTLTVLSVIILRRKLPSAERPYRAWGYPLPPLLYAGSSLIVLAILLRDLDPSVFLGGGWFVLALLFHRLVLRRRETGHAEVG